MAIGRALAFKFLDGLQSNSLLDYEGPYAVVSLLSTREGVP